MEKKKKIKRRIGTVLIIALIIMALLIPFVFATASQATQNKAENLFFSVDSTNKTPGSMLEMKVNLGEIDYDSFLFTLTSNDETLENIDASDVSDSTDIEKEENGIVISGNKEKISVNEIKLYYQIPQNIAVGSTFTLKASIEEEDTEKETENTESTQIEDNNENNKQTIEITITIVAEDEQKTNDESNSQNGDSQSNQNDKNMQNASTNNLPNNSNTKQEQNNNGVAQSNTKNTMSMGTMQTSTSTTRTGGSSMQSETVTYNGSSNNYLETLVVEGYELNTDFMKENTTYFINLKEESSSLKITATAEDADAKVCIYGNKNIKDGSKILIYVTAENGSVRTYRVYVTK